MINFVKIEFFKLKNSKVFLLSLLGSLAPAILVFLGLSGRFEDFALLSSYTNLYMLCFFGIFLTTIVVAYLYSRELNEHTLKSILPTPISRSKYLIGKSIVFLIWILILCSICFFASVLLAYITGVNGMTFNLVLKQYIQMIFGGSLLFIVMSPIMFISMLMKNMVPAMITAAVLSFGNIVAYGQSQAIYYPWILPTIISSGEITQYTSNMTIVYSIILITFAIGSILSYLQLTQKDIQL